MPLVGTTLYYRISNETQSNQVQPTARRERERERISCAIAYTHQPIGPNDNRLDRHRIVSRVILWARRHCAIRFEFELTVWFCVRRTSTIFLSHWTHRCEMGNRWRTQICGAQVKNITVFFLYAVFIHSSRVESGRRTHFADAHTTHSFAFGQWSQSRSVIPSPPVNLADLWI